jgi:LysM repeat protein
MSKNSKNTLLDNIIKILIILLLLGALLIVSIFAIDKLKDKGFKNEIGKKEEVINTDEIDKSIKQTQNKVYSQDEMQEIVQMMMDQMNELNKSTDSEGEKLSTDEQDNNSDYTNLISTLTEATIDDDEELFETKEADEQVEAKNSNERVDHYNKVVVDNSMYSEDNLDALSKKIGSIVDDMSAHQSSATSYTQNISKEIETRADEMRVIVVKRGDTLSKIALRAYGRVSDYHKLVEANRDLIKNPNHIFVGQKLRIPTL